MAEAFGKFAMLPNHGFFKLDRVVMDLVAELFLFPMNFIQQLVLQVLYFAEKNIQVVIHNILNRRSVSGRLPVVSVLRAKCRREEPTVYSL
jgi:hypothetical protein